MTGQHRHTASTITDAQLDRVYEELAAVRKAYTEADAVAMLRGCQLVVAQDAARIAEGDRDAAEERRDELAAAVDRVRELHRKASHGDVCVYCASGQRIGYDATWPCDTIRVLDGPPASPAVPPQHLGNGANAEDCPGCSGTNPPYPWVCPGPDTTTA